MMLQLAGQRLTLEDIEAVAESRLPASLDARARERMEVSQAVVRRIVEKGDAVYGVNTGFGRLCDQRIPHEELLNAQVNLVRSHCCGLGDPLSEPEVRAMLLLRANVLAIGLSGARPVVAETLLRMLEAGVHPVIPEKGSVGASGDLAPLAHLALAAIGEGTVFYGGTGSGAGGSGGKITAREALQKTGIEPLVLQPKEGLALLNGTQAMAAVAAIALSRALRLVRMADVSGAMSLEALLGTPTAFDERIHAARPHPHQAAVAAHLRSLLRESEIRKSHEIGDPRVQDAYSIRCMPQVHGAVRMALDHAREVVEVESGSATDNPLVFAETGDVLSGGNFHGAPLALVLDYAAIALVDLMSISERRIDRLVNPDLNEGLPAFLSAHPGSCSGFMIAHVAAVSLLAEARVLAHPASIDNAPTSGGKEDHVSMGMTSALKLRSIVGLAEKVVAIELMAAAEGLEYRKPLKPGLGVLAAYEQIREISPRLDTDRPLGPDIERTAQAIKDRRFDSQ